MSWQIRNSWNDFTCRKKNRNVKKNHDGWKMYQDKMTWSKRRAVAAVLWNLFTGKKKEEDTKRNYWKKKTVEITAMSAKIPCFMNNK